MKFTAELQRIGANLWALGPRRLAVLGLVCAVVTAGIGFGSYYLNRPEHETLYTGLTTQDMGRIGVTLREGGIPFDVAADGTKVLVPRGHASRARMLLAERGLPSGTTSGYELFDKLGPLGLTTFMQDVTRARAMEGELARSIQGMRGVLGVRVHIVLPDNGTYRRSRSVGSASVVIRSDPSAPFRSGQAVRHLVAAAVPGMTIDHVRVVGTDGTILSGGADGPATPGHMVELERAIGKDIQDNIRRTLAPYLGIENFELSAAVRLNIDKRQTNETSFDPDAKAERSIRVVKETNNTQSTAQRAAVTVEQNLPGEPTAAPPGDQSKKQQERKEETTNFELGSKTTQVVSEGYRIEHVSVALVVNKKRLLAGAAGNAAPDLESQIKDVERLISSAAGIDSRRGDKVSVSAVEFLDPATGTPIEAGWTETAIGYATPLLKALSVIAAAFVLGWYGLRPTARLLLEPPKPAVSLGSTGPATHLSGNGQANLGLLPNPSASVDASAATPLGLTPQERLERLVDQDEDRAATVLRQWIHGAMAE